jgi:hypothetical protein
MFCFPSMMLNEFLLSLFFFLFALSGPEVCSTRVKETQRGRSIFYPTSGEGEGSPLGFQRHLVLKLDGQLTRFMPGTLFVRWLSIASKSWNPR